MGASLQASLRGVRQQRRELLRDEVHVVQPVRERDNNAAAAVCGWLNCT